MRRLLPASLLVLACLVAPGTALAARGLELAVQDDGVLLRHDYGDPALALDRARDLHAKRVRVNLAWAASMPRDQAAARSEPASIAWDFSALERLYADAAARGLLLQVTLTGPAPAWAAGDHRIGYDHPDALAFGRFARAAAVAFAGRIDRWSIWNEPNWHRFLQPTASAPVLYRRLFFTGSAAIRAVDPQAAVLIGELMPGASRLRSTPALAFLRAVTCSRPDYRAAKRCPALVSDGFALHPYNFARAPRAARSQRADVVEMGSLGRLTAALDRLARRHALATPDGRALPVYLTEFGYFTQGPVAQSPRTQARWLAEAWRIARANPRVRQLLQYQLIDPWPKAVTWRTALLDRSGAPRPAYFTLRALAAAG